MSEESTPRRRLRWVVDLRVRLVVTTTVVVMQLAVLIGAIVTHRSLPDAVGIGSFTLGMGMLVLIAVIAVRERSVHARDRADVAQPQYFMGGLSVSIAGDRDGVAAVMSRLPGTGRMNALALQAAALTVGTLEEAAEALSRFASADLPHVAIGVVSDVTTARVVVWVTAGGHSSTLCQQLDLGSRRPVSEHCADAVVSALERHDHSRQV